MAQALVLQFVTIQACKDNSHLYIPPLFPVSSPQLSTFFKEGVLKSKTYLLKVDESAKTPRVDGERVPLALLGALDIFCLFIYSLEVSHRAASAKITT